MMGRIAVAMLLLGVVAAPAVAQDVRPPAARQGEADLVTVRTQCCTIAAVDRRTGVVTVRIVGTDDTYSFRVTDREVLSGLRPGQPVMESTSCAATAVDANGRCGTNVPRDADTRPKKCTTTDSAGREYNVPCPTYL